MESIGWPDNLPDGFCSKGSPHAGHVPHPGGHPDDRHGRPVSNPSSREFFLRRRPADRDRTMRCLSRARWPIGVKRNTTILVFSLTCSIVYSISAGPFWVFHDPTALPGHTYVEICLSAPDPNVGAPEYQRVEVCSRRLEGPPRLD